LTTDQIGNLNADQLTVITSTQLRAIELQDVPFLSGAQFDALGYSKVNSLTSDQKAAVTTSQIAAITDESIRGIFI
jgi:hypothetical protein